MTLAVALTELCFPHGPTPITVGAIELCHDTDATMAPSAEHDRDVLRCTRDVDGPRYDGMSDTVGPASRQTGRMPRLPCDAALEV